MGVGRLSLVFNANIARGSAIARPAVSNKMIRGFLALVLLCKCARAHACARVYVRFESRCCRFCSFSSTADLNLGRRRCHLRRHRNRCTHGRMLGCTSSMQLAGPRPLATVRQKRHGTRQRFAEQHVEKRTCWFLSKLVLNRFRKVQFLT